MRERVGQRFEFVPALAVQCVLIEVWSLQPVSSKRAGASGVWNNTGTDSASRARSEPRRRQTTCMYFQVDL